MMSTVDFRKQLSKQLGFIKNSCELYDRGDYEEAIRIAVSIRILIHETSTQTPLLKHLEALDISLLSSEPRRPSNSEPFEDGIQRLEISFGIAPISFGRKQVSVEPELENSRHREPLPVSEWWNQTVFVVPPANLEISRRSLVLAAANKDGGAHVDSRLAPDYQRVIEALRFDAAIVTRNDREEKVLADFHLVGLRQLGYEILNSPELTGLAEPKNGQSRS